MNRTLFLSVFLLIGIFITIGISQTDTIVDVPPMTEWFVSTGTLGAVIVGLIAFARKHLAPWLDGIYVPLASIALGLALGLFGSATGLLARDLFGGAAFGLLSGLAASLGVDGIRTVIGSSQGESWHDSDRTRLRK